MSAERWTIEKAEGWPFPQMDEIFRSGRKAWLRVTEEDYWYALEVVPPVYLPGGFQLGEPLSHDEQDRPIRATYVVRKGIPHRYYARYMTADELPGALTGLDQARRALLAVGQPA